MAEPAALRATSTTPTAQQRASDPDQSVWVNASAGSGKTTILTNRVTRLLLSGVRPDKILCLTFTRAAAAEMALRVTKTLSHWAVCSDNDLNASLSDLQGRPPMPDEMTRARRLFAAALNCPGGMRIRTLHAFGQEILRRFPVEAGLPPHFAVIEETEAKNLQDDILTDLLRTLSMEPVIGDGVMDRAGAGERTVNTPSPSMNTLVSAPLTTLIATLGEHGFRNAVQHVLHERAHIQEAVTTAGGIDALVGNIRDQLGLTPTDTETEVIRAALAPPAFDEEAIRFAATLLLEGLVTAKKRGQEILGWLSLDTEQRIASFATYQSAFLKKDGDLYKDYADKNLRAKYTDLDDLLRYEAERLKALAERCALLETATITEAVLRFGLTLIDRYDKRKNRQAALDYDDLVQKTLALLKRPKIAQWILYKLDEGLDHLLVDEAQDTSQTQWDIVATLSEELFSGDGARAKTNRTLFVVGDEKQSIFSFQNAEPEAFAAMRVYFKTKIEAAGKRYGDVPLHVSYRSAPAILRAVDAVFAAPDAARGVSAVPVAHTAHKRDTLFGRVEVWPLIPQPPKDEADETDGAWQLPIGYENEQDPQAALADHIATTIKGWLTSGATLPGENRPIRPGDIMILLRRRGRFADLMVRALKKKTNAIPVTGVDRMRLMEQLAVMDLLALIQFTLLPEDDLNLACLLRSPLINLSEDGLMALAVGREGMPLWQRLKTTAINEGGRGASWHTIHTYLTAWLGKSDFITPFAMLTRILSEPSPASSISGRHALWSRLGADALDPIDELLNAAQNFSRRHPPSLQHFLHWLASGDSEIKREMDSGDASAGGQVRIMTVHASKGLEAPIVFLPDTSNVPRPQDLPKILWDETGGLPFYLAQKPKAEALSPLWQSARMKQMEEYKRLLYVALTRASHRLYIGGWELAKKESDSDSCWHNLIQQGLKQSETGIQNAADTDDIIVWEDPVLRADTIPHREEQKSQPITLPTWALQTAPTETTAAAPIAPSHLMPTGAKPDALFARGRITHRLLQSLPDVDEARREETAARFLSHPQHHLTPEQQTEISTEVLNLLHQPAFAPLFAAGSRAEVPITGTVNNRRIAGQVDRLVDRGTEIWIIDYKTNRSPPADIPAPYRAQMDEYRGVLQAIYPDRFIRCFLLWIDGLRIVEVTE